MNFCRKTLVKQDRFTQSLKLNTQRRSAPSMCAFKEEERSVLISVTLMKGITGYKNCVNYWYHVLYVSEGFNHVTATWKRDFFPVCLFILFYFIFLPSEFLVVSFLLFLLSAFFSIRIRHPQVSGPRFTDTLSVSLFELVVLWSDSFTVWFQRGVCKTRTGYLRMADADGKMRMEKNADNKKSKKETTRNSDGKKKIK